MLPGLTFDLMHETTLGERWKLTQEAATLVRAYQARSSHDSEGNELDDVRATAVGSDAEPGIFMQWRQGAGQPWQVRHTLMQTFTDYYFAGGAERWGGSEPPPPTAEAWASDLFTAVDGPHGPPPGAPVTDWLHFHIP